MVLVLMADKKHNVKFPVMETDCLNDSVRELCLDGRCENILIRSGMYTMKDIISRNDLLSQIKGAGKGSINKIMHAFCEYYYIHLPSKKEKESYLKKLIQLNLQEV